MVTGWFFVGLQGGNVAINGCRPYCSPHGIARVSVSEGLLSESYFKLFLFHFVELCLQLVEAPLQDVTDDGRNAQRRP